MAQPLKRDAVKVGSMIYNALVILTGRGPLTADMFGVYLWKDKPRGKTTSMGGGGDFGAQMFLGRLRSLGFARTTHESGSSSRWEATAIGRNALASALMKAGQPSGLIRDLHATTKDDVNDLSASVQTRALIDTTLRKVVKK